jgi:hypothetical protein
MSTYDVKIHDISKREDRGKGKSYRVRWVVDGKRFERSTAQPGTRMPARTWR